MPKKPKRHELQQRDFRIKHGLEQTKKRVILPERHLFVTEGTKTEPNYLNGLVDLICERYGPSVRKQFDIIGEGTNTLNLLQRAEAHQHNEAYGYQHIWIIYDKDDFPADAFDNTVNRCDSLNKRFQSEATISHSTQFGQTNVLSCGFFYTSIIYRQTLTGNSTALYPITSGGTMRKTMLNFLQH